MVVLRRCLCRQRGGIGAEALVVETSTIWPEEYESWDASDRERIEDPWREVSWGDAITYAANAFRRNPIALRRISRAAPFGAGTHSCHVAADG